MAHPRDPTKSKSASLWRRPAVCPVRETRRIPGDCVLTVDDYLARRSFPDEICRNAHGIDVHFSKRKAVALSRLSIDEARKAIHKRTQAMGIGASMGVPYRCLTPKRLRNVLVAGRCISTDRRTNGSIRIMACCLHTGEAAGIAGAMAATGSRNVHSVDSGALRSKLKACGASLPG